MKQIILITSCFLLFFLGLFFIPFFNIEETSSIWKNYKILSVDKNINENLIIDILQKNGISNVISLSNKKDITNTSIFFDEYYKSTFNYFFDETKNLQLYYIPINQLQNFDTLRDSLNSITDKWEIETEYVHSIIPFIICTLCFIGLLIISKHRFIFIPASIPFLLSSYFMPTLSISIACCFAFISIFYLCSLWNKEGWLKVLERDLVYYFFNLTPLVLVILTGLKSFFIFLISIISSISILYIIYYFGKVKIEKRSFVPVPIKLAENFVIRPAKLKKILLIPLCAFIFLTVFFRFSNFFSVSNTLDDLSIPMPKGYTDEKDFSAKAFDEVSNFEKKDSLVNLHDFIELSWQSTVYPYTTLYQEEKSLKNGDKVIYSDYFVDENSKKIKQVDNKCFTFNDDFITMLLQNHLGKEDTPYVEDLLNAQDEFVSVDYSSPKNNSSNQKTVFFSVPVVICVCIVCLLIVLILYIRNKRSFNVLGLKVAYK